MSDPKEPTAEEMAAHRKRSEENATEDGATAGLEDAKATLVQIWKRTLDDSARHRAMRALEAVLAAERTMRAADAFLRAEGRERRTSFEELRKTAIFRIGHDTRKTP